MSQRKMQDRITVRVAHDKSIYIVYEGNVPPLDGQEYISLNNHQNLLNEAVKKARADSFERGLLQALQAINECCPYPEALDEKTFETIRNSVEIQLEVAREEATLGNVGDEG